MGIFFTSARCFGSLAVRGNVMIVLLFCCLYGEVLFFFSKGRKEERDEMMMEVVFVYKAHLFLPFPWQLVHAQYPIRWLGQ